MHGISVCPCRKNDIIVVSADGTSHASERDRSPLQAARGPVRAWAERFDWANIADEYRALYRELET